MARRVILAICAGMMFAVLAGGARAQSVLEQLVAPGEVHEKHAPYEKNCESCHAPFNKAAQPGLCKDCHKDVAADIAAKKGFHGLSAETSVRPCKACHTDHKGRKSDIVGLDPNTFDHGKTDFPLRGGHVRIQCASCHPAGKRYRETPAVCVACHKKADPHKGQLGDRCGDCHIEAKWTEIRFDHSKTTFLLTGAHVRTACKACHVAQRFKGTPKGCDDCHAKNDVHAGRFGKDCESCHNTESWKGGQFDHDKTGFPLTGAHGMIKCEACHAGAPAAVKLNKDCASCHRKDDAHKGANGPRCASCHSTSSWKETSFNHDTQTKFPLQGGHDNLACVQCHKRPPIEEKLSTACVACHGAKDPHQGQEGSNCVQCHNDRDWKKASFDHDLSQFPLIGKHEKAACVTCHVSKRFKDASVACIDCHRKADIHEGRLGENCGLCHNAVDWKKWFFDHDSQTRFPITGAHIGLACERCHTRKNVERAKAPTACVGCHARDDIHQGGFGPFCEKCHSTDSFATIHMKN